MTNFNLQDYDLNQRQHLYIDSQKRWEIYQIKHCQNNSNILIQEFFPPKIANDFLTFDELYEHQKNILSSLNQLTDHPSVPRLLKSSVQSSSPENEEQSTVIAKYLIFEHQGETSINEHKNALTYEYLKLIIEQILTLLIKLQSNAVPLIHRNIQPDNLFVSFEGEGKVLLLDWRFATDINAEVNLLQDLIRENNKLIIPNQRLKKLDLSYDNYGLGMTLILLMIGKKVEEIDELIDANNRINFRELDAIINGKYSLPFLNWLEKMVDPDPKMRYPDAQAALKAFNEFNYALEGKPKLDISHPIIVFQSTNVCEVLKQKIVLKNTVEGTILEIDKIEVKPYDTGMPYIKFSPQTLKIQGLKEKSLTISIDTSYIQEKTTLQRTILIHSNSSHEPLSIPLSVQTSSLPAKDKSFAGLWLTGILLCSILLPTSMIVGWFSQHYFIEEIEKIWDQ